MQNTDLDVAKIVDEVMENMVAGLETLKREYAQVSEQLQKLSTAIAEQVGAIKGSRELKRALEAAAKAIESNGYEVKTIEALATKSEPIEAEAPKAKSE